MGNIFRAWRSLDKGGGPEREVGKPQRTTRRGQKQWAGHRCSLKCITKRVGGATKAARKNSVAVSWKGLKR